MNIVVYYPAAQTGGAKAILESFLEFVDASTENHNWYFVTSMNIHQMNSNNIKVISFPNGKMKWITKFISDNLRLNYLLFRTKADVLISLQNILPFWVYRAKKLLLVHQALPFQEVPIYSWKSISEIKLNVKLAIMKILIQRSIKRCDICFVQTAFFRKLIMKSVNTPDKYVILKKKVFSKREFLCESDQSKFFYPSNEMKYKNNEILARAVKILNDKGYKNFIVEITASIKEQNENLISINTLNRQQITEKYQHSILLYPSLVESLGLPLVESRDIGGVIFAANLEYAREVLENYPNAFFFDPSSAEDLALLMEKAMNNELELSKMSSMELYSFNYWQTLMEHIND